MSGILRRYGGDAGYSWRKWEDPLAAGRELRTIRRLRVILWWIGCLDVGALLAVLIGR